MEVVEFHVTPAGQAHRRITDAIELIDEALDGAAME